MFSVEEILQASASEIQMRDGAKIFRHAENGRPPIAWAVLSYDNLWLCSRGEQGDEVYWDLDRRTFFATLEGAAQAWERAHQANSGLYKGQW
jgi:hypothetical protein